MERVSRRAMLTTASVTVVAAGVAAATGSMAVSDAKTSASPAAAALSDQVVARVRNLSSGEVDLFIGERQVTVRNLALANSIAYAAQKHTA